MTYNLKTTKSLDDMVDAWLSCGLWSVIGEGEETHLPPITADQTMREYLQQWRDFRTTAREEVQNACADCEINHSYFHRARVESIHYCDIMIQVSAQMKRDSRYGSIHKQWLDYIEIHSACEVPYHVHRVECQGCPLNQPIEIDTGLDIAEIRLCSVFERYSPRPGVEYTEEHRLVHFKNDKRADRFGGELQ